MSKFKVGDKVRVREGLKVGNYYNLTCNFNDGMEKYKGEILTISEVLNRSSDRYFVEENRFIWSNNMLEPVKKEYTFKEVVEKIEEGEVYKSINSSVWRVREVYLEDGEIILKGEIGSHPSFPNDVGISAEQRFTLEEKQKKYLIYEVEHIQNGKRYDFRGKNTIPMVDHFVICDTEYGKTYGKVVDAKMVLMTESEYMKYKECWRAN